MLSPEAPVDPGIADLLEPGPIKRVRIDFTTACNLRCVYCAVSGPNYAAAEMPAEVVNRVVANISAIQRHNALATIMVNGHGETTSIDNWPRLIEPLLQTGIPVAMQSNFAKPFSADELSTLSRMAYIVVSIDSADRQMLMKIRRSVDVRQIVFNIAQVRATAVDSDRLPPEFHFASGLYDKNTLDIGDVVRLGLARDVNAFLFWNLERYPDVEATVPEHDRVKRLDDLPNEQLRPRIEAIQKSIGLLKRHGVGVVVSGNFIDSLARRVGLNE
jgi:hypothetical protein